MRVEEARRPARRSRRPAAAPASRRSAAAPGGPSQKLGMLALDHRQRRRTTWSKSDAAPVGGEDADRHRDGAAIRIANRVRKKVGSARSARAASTGLVEEDRLAEIAAQQLAEDRARTARGSAGRGPSRVAQGRDVRRRGVRAQHDGRRIARRHAHDHEHDRDDDEHHRGHAEQALQDVAAHGRRLSTRAWAPAVAARPPRAAHGVT